MCMAQAHTKQSADCNSTGRRKDGKLVTAKVSTSRLDLGFGIATLGVVIRVVPTWSFFRNNSRSIGRTYCATFRDTTRVS